MKKRKIPILLILGIVLILSSLTMVIVLQLQAQQGVAKSQKVMAKMEELLPERSRGTPGLYSNTQMPVLNIEGTDYVSMLQVPGFDVALPVADHWNPDRLAEGPARFCGSAYDHTLVIGGTDYEKQLAFCGRIENGAVITLTDMTGAEFFYTVAKVERSTKAEQGWLADPEYDMTLFCRATYSMEYIAVRCNYRANG
jgi:sortase (surface protein transpeptidase)